jgi:hypothetical protein
MTVLSRTPIAVVLLAAAFVSWRAADTSRALADSHERIATLDFSAELAAPDEGAWTRRLAAILDADAALHRTIAGYWISPDTATAEDDQRLLQFAANAAFRRLQREASGGAIAPERLDPVMQGYASVLRQAGFDRDAAYNYEYVARLRDRSARATPSTTPPTSIHGRRGAHPPPTKGEEFEIMTPMDYGDREAQPEQTPGRKLPRKG